MDDTAEAAARSAGTVAGPDGSHRPKDARIFLIGMMGAGKSAVGTRLSALLAWPYLDNDVLLLEQEGRDLLNLSAEGPEVLHSAESRLANALSRRPPPFVAGIPASLADNPAWLGQLREAGLVIYLRCSPATLAQRIAASAARPFVGEQPLAWIDPTLRARAVVFERSADLLLDTDDASPAQLAQDIASSLHR